MPSPVEYQSPLDNSSEVPKISEVVERFRQTGLKIALQKDGELTPYSLVILQRLFGIESVTTCMPRTLISVCESCEGDLGIMFVKNRAICSLVNQGIAQLAVVGSDQLIETEESGKRNIRILYAFESFKRWPFVLAVPKDKIPIRMGDIKTIASQFPATTSRVLLPDYPEVQIIPTQGSTEIMPYLMVDGKPVDAITDILVTGTTLRHNGLVPLDPPLMYFYPVVICPDNNPPPIDITGLASLDLDLL